MSRNNWLAVFVVALISTGTWLQFAAAKELEKVVAADVAVTASTEETVKSSAQEKADSDAAETPPVELFQAVKDGKAELTFIAKNDHAGRVILTNNTKQPLNLELPEAF